jgi:hypothetical protein
MRALHVENAATKGAEIETLSTWIRTRVEERMELIRFGRGSVVK